MPTPLIIKAAKTAMNMMLYMFVYAKLYQTVFHFV
jgi:hypothetical protein